MGSFSASDVARADDAAGPVRTAVKALAEFLAANGRAVPAYIASL